MGLPHVLLPRLMTLMISRNTGKKFYVADPIEQWDCINSVGLRNHFLCTVYASRIMVPQKDGLIVNISSVGGLTYLFNVAYGIGKAACDRMAADCARYTSLCCKCLHSFACFYCKMPKYVPEGGNEGGKPLPLAFQYLIFMIKRPCDSNLVIISSLASKCQHFKLRVL